MTEPADDSEVTQLLFYTTAGCHLCEQAAALLVQLQQSHHVSIEAIDISSDTALVAAYGVRIPVVRDVAKNRELGWPFQLTELQNLVCYSQAS